MVHGEGAAAASAPIAARPATPCRAPADGAQPGSNPAGLALENACGLLLSLIG